MNLTVEPVLLVSFAGNNDTATTFSVESSEADPSSSCNGLSKIINYCQAYYDTRPDWRWSVLVLQLCLILLFISLLSSTAEHYFVPPIKYICRKLSIPDYIAGITLLAAGNGAPDVFSAVSGLDSQSDFGVTLGLLLGSSIFTTTVILASVLLATQQAQKAVIVPGAFVRDVCAYIVTTVSILIICSDGKVWLYETLSLLCCYVAYLAVIVCSHYHSTAASLASELDYEDENEDKDEEDLESLLVLAPSPLPSPPPSSSSSSSSLPLLCLENPQQQQQQLQHQGSELLFLRAASDEKRRVAAQESDSSHASSDCFPGLEIFSIYSDHHHQYSRRPLLWRRPLVYLQSLIELPFTLLRILSIPAFGALWGGPVRQVITALSPFPIVLLVYFRFNYAHNWGLHTGSFLSSWAPLWLAMMILGALPAAIILFFNTRPWIYPKGFMIMLLVGLGTCIIWLDLFADELVALVETLGVETSMKPAILGLTLLAIGNSVGDFVADTAFARDGNPQMGLSSCFGSPMFNDVIGLGIALSISCAKAGGGSKPLLVHITKELYISWGFLLVSLTCSLTAFIGFGFQPPLRAHAYFLCGLYGVFFVFVVAMQFGLAV